MGYFNPILYCIKTFLRLFIKKFFWFILILICLFLGFIIFNVNDVFAYSTTVTYYYDYDRYDVDFYYESPTKGGIIICDSTGAPYRLLFRGNNQGGSINSFYFDSSTNTITCNSYFGNLCTYSYDSVTGIYNSVWSYNYMSNSFVMPDGAFILYANKNVYYTGTSDVYLASETLNFNFVSDTAFIAPYIVNDDTDVNSWSFDTLNISLGSVEYDHSNSYYLDYSLSGVYYGFELRDYYNSELGYFVIPRNQLTNNVVLRNGDNLSFSLNYRSLIDVIRYELGDYTLTLTSQEQDDINADSDKYVQGEILDEQKKTNNKLDDINNSINNSDVDFTTSDLPSDSTTDITSDGVNGIFTSIYNAFCVGEPQDIVFPIPYTNKSITLEADYNYNMLSSVNASWLITIIQAFWWYLISRFIIKDVMDKINKIKGGNIEDIETSNIRGDML